MGVKLRRGVARDRPRRVVLELGGNEFAGRFSRMVAADAGLRIPFKLVKSFSNGGAMGFPDSAVATDKSRERNRLRSRKGRIPPRPDARRS